MASLSQDSATGATNFLRLLELQPLQNLAKNFDIDVASCLDEIIHELKIGHDEDDVQYDAETLNFAHAALAVQNSAHIYSRKVDHLYSLATTTAEDIADSNKQKKRDDRSKELESMDAFFELHQDPEFLLLDDVPNDAKKDMEVKSARLSLSTRYSLSSRTSINWSRDSIEMSRYEDQMRHSRVNASVRELLRNSGSGFFSSNQINADGCLCLPGSRPREIESNGKLSLNISDHVEGRHVHEEDGDFPMHGIDHDNDDNDGPAFNFPTEDHDDDNIGFADDGPTADVRKHVSFAPATICSAKKVDIWEMLDPNKETLKGKPLRVGKTIVLPPGIDSRPSDVVTGARTRRIASRAKETTMAEAPTFRSLTMETFQATLAARKRSHSALVNADDSIGIVDALMPTVPLRGFCFGSEFAYIAKANTARRAAERRERRKEEQLKANSQHEINPPVEQLDYDDDDDDGVGFVFGGEDDHDNYGGEPDSQFASNTGLASMDDAFQHRLLDHATEDADNAQTFEELCRLHLGSLKESNNKYMNRSKLAKRVNEWQERMAVALDAEMERPVFDIHEYGQSVIRLAEKESQRLAYSSKDVDLTDEDASECIAFHEVVRHQPQHEICRMFLATLSLCCSGNVEVLDNTGGDGSTLMLKLISAKVDTPMEQYVAPSELATRH
ncbi:hypothetical protein MPSEU_000493200 [Mayamaea pseudoterrestris]|nr:hypothetical protein MPSEU_000493200 [Mayamaea pseudoterrestris]